MLAELANGGFTHSTIQPQYTLRWLSEPDQGLYDALNKGLRLATGDVIGILHTDDVWEPGVLKRVSDAFRREASLECGRDGRNDHSCRLGGEEACFEGGEASGLPDGGNGREEFPPGEASFAHPKAEASFRTPGPSIDGIYDDLFYVDADDISRVRRVWRSGSYDKRKWGNGWMPPHPALFVTRELAERVGEYRLDLGSAADYEWMLRAGLVHNAKLVYIQDVEKRGHPHHSTFSPSDDLERENAGMCGLLFSPFVRMRVGGGKAMCR